MTAPFVLSCILSFVTGFWLGLIITRMIDHDLSTEPETDAAAAGERGKTVIKGDRWRATINPTQGFEPPVLTPYPLHKYKRGHPDNRFCCDCGAGEYHAVHGPNGPKPNRELWERIQRERSTDL